MKVSDIMTRRVVSVAPEIAIREAIRLMLKHHVSGLPVVDAHHQLVGIVSSPIFFGALKPGRSDRDRVGWMRSSALVRRLKACVRSHGDKVRDVMSPDPVTTTGDMSLDAVVGLMEKHRIKRLPVMRGCKLVGIVSRANLMRALAHISRSAPAVSKDDAAVRDHVLRAIRNQSWAAGASVDVLIRDGMADLWGTISDVEQREALRVLVETTPGVKRVEDHLVWHGDPVSVT